MTKHLRDLTIDEVDMILCSLESQRKKYTELKEVEEEQLHIELINLLKSPDIRVFITNFTIKENDN